MSTRQQLDQALGAHALLRTRLQGALAQGRMEATPASLAGHAACPFGRWLAGPTVAPATRATAQYASARTLHERVHIEAAKVAILIGRGDLDAARAALAPGGAFTVASAAFTAALHEWKQRLSAEPAARALGRALPAAPRSAFGLHPSA